MAGGNEEGIVPTTTSMQRHVKAITQTRRQSDSRSYSSALTGRRILHTNHAIRGTQRNGIRAPNTRTRV